MSNRFAGAERLGDRRRRRLATQMDAPPETDLAEETLSSPRRRFEFRVDSPNTTPSAPELPLENLVPLAWWKYTLVATGAVAIIGLLAAASRYSTDLAAIGGPGVETLLDATTTPLPSAFGALLLAVASLFAWLTAWGRSRSVRDFSGSYHRWQRIAIAAFAFAAAHALRLHHVCVATVVHFVPRDVWRRETVLWLLPTVVAAAACGGAVRREVTRSRASTILLLLASLFYVIAAVLQLKMEALLEDLPRTVLVQTLVLLGHATVAMCFWVHARFVLYFNPDPVESNSARGQVGRPSLRFLTRWFARRASRPEIAIDAGKSEVGESEPHDEAEESEAVAKTQRRKPPKRPVRKPAATTSKPRREVESSNDPDPDDSEPAAPTDVPDDSCDLANEISLSDSSQPILHTAAESSVSDQKPVEVPAPERSTNSPLNPASHDRRDNLVPTEWETAPAPMPLRSPEAKPTIPAVPVNAADIAEPEEFQCTDAPSAGCASADDEDEEGDSAGNLNLKGLSKKERRRMKQQQRERERSQQK